MPRFPLITALGASFVLAALVASSGCANLSENANPDLSLIDTWRVSPSQYAFDYRQCVQLANQTNSGERAVVGIIGGALIGALIGQSYGGGRYSGYGTRLGAAYGGVGGVASGEVEKQQVLRRCLSNRGYAVIR